MQKLSTYVKRHILKIIISTGVMYFVLCYTDTRVFITFSEKLFSVKDTDDKFPNNLQQMIDGTIKTSDDNPILINYIKKQMNPPAPSDKTLNLSKPLHTGQIGQVEEILKYFNGKTNGVFIEAGAWDGEYLSNTLFLEANASWTGLLVEPNLGAYRLLEKRNRRSHSIHSCLAVDRHPSKVEFDAADVFGGINQELDKVDTENMERMRDSIPANMRSKYPVQCYPLYSLILALGRPKIDFLSLDIEGAELAVLNTIPWDKVEIELVMIEVEHSDKAAIARTMTEAGYKEWKNLKDQDIIYKKN